MYGGPLHSVGFTERVLAQLSDVDKATYPTYDRIEGMLHTALEEITLGAKDKDAAKSNGEKTLDPTIPKTDPAALDAHPFFVTPGSLAKKIHCQAPPLAAVRGALKRAGFGVTMSHCKPGSIKTNAPWAAIWHIMLEWVRQKAPLKNNPKAASTGYVILSKSSAHKLDAEEPTDTEAHESHSDAAPIEVDAVSRVNGTDEATEAQHPEKQQTRPSYLGTDFEVVFDEALGKEGLDRGKYVRYQLAPRENWGPMARAK